MTSQGASDTFSPYGVDLFGEPIVPDNNSPVAKKFVFPPFSVLNARDGEWQARKKAWQDMGIKSEVGREGSLSYAIPLKKYDKENMSEEYYGDQAQSLNTSIFDPVLCELTYRWYSREGSQILDPFAGGSVRGVVASCLGRNYWGGELRKEQVLANREQVKELCYTNPPEYEIGDSRLTVKDAPPADFVFSCPPYGDLEVYSNDRDDLSNMDWHAFKAGYKHVIFNAVQKLKENRFACFVVGDFRDKKGLYRNFVSTTIEAFHAAGAHLYNEAILVTSVGSASMRINRQFDAGRKLAKTHQNVLTFVKGDWKKAANYVTSK